MPEPPGAHPAVDRGTFARAAALALVPSLVAILAPLPVAADGMALTKQQIRHAENVISDCLSELNNIKHIIYQHDRCPPCKPGHPCDPCEKYFDQALDALNVLLKALERHS